MADRTDLGSGLSYAFFQWDSDRELNPQYKDVPSVDKAGIVIYLDETDRALGSCWFDTPEVNAIPGFENRTRWQLLSLDPLHIEPSIQMYDDGHKPSYHGWIREGKWVSA